MSSRPKADMTFSTRAFTLSGWVMSVGTGQGVVSGLRERFGDCGAFLRVQIHHGDRRAGFRQRPAEFRAEQSNAAGDDCHAVSKVEFIENGCHIDLFSLAFGIQRHLQRTDTIMKRANRFRLAAHHGDEMFHLIHKHHITLKTFGWSELLSTQVQAGWHSTLPKGWDIR